MPAPALDFESLFQKLTGRVPYGWQRRMYADLLGGSLPDALDLPTGLGKTSVMTIWLLARAAGASVPRRLVYVVDRRAVVDQASAEAQTLRLRLMTEGDAQMQSLRDALGLDADGLPVSTLRGQLTDNRAWLQRPEGVAIVVGTVDMVGSRLLFSGYGVSRRMRPVHAALLAIDSLIVLDEAHLVPPFEALVKASAAMAAQFQRRAALPVTPLRVMSLSATARSQGAGCFSLTDAERGDPPVAARLNAVKRLRLHPPIAAEALAETMAKSAWDLAQPGAAVAVFCNSRKVAQAVVRQLRESCKRLDGKSKTPRVELLVGERRVFDRAALVASAVFARFSPVRHAPSAPPGALQGPAFLVATSAGEVGIDLDADHLVCDLVPWERMVQRLGRVNRRPLPGAALVDVFPAPQPAEKDAEQAVLELGRYSAPFESPAWPPGDDGRLDASPGALLALRRDAAFAQLARQATSEAPLHPALTLPHLQAWAMTSLEQHPGRTLVAPWLRGWVDAEPECRVVWRRHLPVQADADRTRGAGGASLSVDAAFLLACLPHLSETLQAPCWRVAEVLKTRAKALQQATASAGTGAALPPVCVVLLDGDGGVDQVLGVDRLVDEMPKDRLERLLIDTTVIVDVRLGGLDADGLLDAKCDDLPRTLDDGGTWVPAPQDVGFRVRVPTSGDDVEPKAGWCLQANWAAREDAEWPDLVVDVRRALRSDEGDPALAKWAQRLGEHQAWAGRHAAAIAAAVGLNSEAAQVLRLAAEVHDEGKRRPEWQRALGMRADRGDAWAKSGRRRGPDRLQNGLSDGAAHPALMAGYRHEFGSVHDAIAAAQGLPEAWRDLFLHVVAAHHGNARPTIHPHDPARPPAATAALAQDIALRYARLDAHWGPWALAWWETVLRAADWHASAELNVADPAEGADHG